MQQLLNAPVEVSTKSSSTVSDSALVRAANSQRPEAGREIRSDASRTQDTASGARQFFTKPEHFIWLEISLVREVESVFIQREGKAFNVLIVVNDRDDNVRDRIYDREAAIIDHLVEFDFSFRVLPRMGLTENQLNVPSIAAYRRR